MQLGAEQFIGLFGIREENLSLFKDELGVELFTHGGEIVITGEPEKVDLAKLTFEKLVEILLRGENVDRTRIRYAIELAAEGKADRIGEIMRDVIAITYRGRQVKCKTLGQKQYVEAIRSNTCCFAVGQMCIRDRLSMVLSWYEQKAVCILLTLLHLGVKNILLGPSLPAFVSPNVLKFLVETYGIRPITTPEVDLKAILG